MKDKLPVYILIRTSKRPLFFRIMMNSIKKQTYPNIVTIVHTDDSEDNYIEGDIIIKSKRDISLGRGHYNLYCNKLLDAIPDGPGWYHFIDDDDMYAGPDVIERFIAASRENFINVARTHRGGNIIWPKSWGAQRSFQSECFLLHTMHKNKARWWSKTGGDHNYSLQLTNMLEINWIEDLIVCTALDGKGRGWRFDLNESKAKKEFYKQIRSNKEPKKDDGKMVEVIFKRRVTGRSSQRGRVGEIKIIPRYYAEKLLRYSPPKVKILKEV
jgi:hypothetical protein